MDLPDEGSEAEEDWSDPEGADTPQGPGDEPWEPEGDDASDLWPEPVASADAPEDWASDAQDPGDDWVVGPPSPDDEPTRPLGPPHSRTFVGYWERADLLDLGVEGIDVLCDTTAARSILRVSFEPLLEEGDLPASVVLDLGHGPVEVEVEEDEDACFVRTRVRLRGVILEARPALEPSQGPALLVLGRDLLKGRFVVDVALAHPRS